MNLNNFKQNTYNMIINEDNFWSVINDLKWYETYKEFKDNSINFISEYLMHRYNIDEISELQRYEVEKRFEMETIIRNFLNENEDNNINDTEIFNLASYIVGLGRTMYFFIKDNPKLIYDLQNAYNVCFEDGFDKAIYSLNFANQ